MRPTFRAGKFQPDPDKDFQEELAFHLAMKVDELMEKGFSREEAEAEGVVTTAPPPPAEAPAVSEAEPPVEPEPPVEREPVTQTTAVPEEPEKKGGSAKWLLIGGGAAAVSFLLPEVIREFRREHGGILFQVREAGSRDVRELLPLAKSAASTSSTSP